MAIEKILLKDKVYKKIVEMICSGELLPGKIITEGQMIDFFSVSKSPVREALIQLCHEEVLKSIPRCGYEVVKVSAKNIRDLTELRLYLELNCLPHVQESLDEKKLEELHLQNAARHVANKDIWQAWHNNINFHLTLNSYHGNSQIYKTLEKVLATCTRAYAQLYANHQADIAPSEGQETFHDLIVDALEKHKIYSAYEYLRQDILLMEQQLLLHNIAS